MFKMKQEGNEYWFALKVLSTPEARVMYGDLYFELSRMQDVIIPKLNERIAESGLYGEFGYPEVPEGKAIEDVRRRARTIAHDRVCCKFLEFGIAHETFGEKVKLPWLVARFEPYGPMADSFRELLSGPQGVWQFGLRGKKGTNQWMMKQWAVESIITFDVITDNKEEKNEGL